MLDMEKRPTQQLQLQVRCEGGLPYRTGTKTLDGNLLKRHLRKAA